MLDINSSSIKDFYHAMNAKDLHGMAKCLHEDVQFVGPLAEFTGKEDVLKGYSQFLTFFKDLTIRAKVGFGNQMMLAYDVNFPQPIGEVRTASLITFKDNLIVRIEIFCDGRPFVKL